MLTFTIVSVEYVLFRKFRIDVVEMKSYALLFGLWTLASAAPSDDTLTVCKYLYAKYPQYLAFDPLGTNAALTSGNASIYNEINKYDPCLCMVSTLFD